MKRERRRRRRREENENHLDWTRKLSVEKRKRENELK